MFPSLILFFFNELIKVEVKNKFIRGVAASEKKEEKKTQKNEWKM